MMNGSSFKKHRNKIIDILQNNDLSESLIFMPSPSEPKEEFTESELPFLQEGIFFWLTGWDKPSSSLIIDVKNRHSILITPHYDEEYEIWYGKAPSNDEIIEQTGVDEVLQGADTNTVLNNLEKSLHPKHRLLAFPHQPSQTNDDIGTLVCAVSIGRREKFDHEIISLRKASVTTSNALVEVMKNCKPEIPESNLEALFLFHGTLLGGRGLSFPITVASGKHAAHLHYSENKDIAHDGDLVLIDCGLYVDHYAGDVTRTFPVNGKFTEIQKKVYNAMLRAQNSLIECVKPGVTLYELENNLFVHIFEVLRMLKIVKIDEEYNRKVAELFCPHSLSHHIGVSVHDWSFYNGQSLLNVNILDAFTLLPNMVISIEPGIYFNARLLQRHVNNPEYAIVDFARALELADTVCAIRIEDDIRVTPDGREVLSTCPKTVEEIEAIMAQNK
ncbi:putative Xaa-Pro aminopeptidase [Tritrichomonas foetus]|uniref:Xaa-Pro aminopeptidase n=1 Tax=Tritrichomonas foetus TaxID=1144522 RepID=A0A1J4K2J7_9EUKA|nr:putative Xaa-Pro aminopeptidase [Tritrichomonas foetus]|eukprot:OHT05024.1 putative Xaa-Pro aminopeptidase [Tritrichomonas foetus]